MQYARLLAAAPVALLVVMSAGCGARGQPEPNGPGGEEARLPVKLKVDAPLYLPGEEFHWEISFRGLRGARAVMVVGEPGTADDRMVVILRSRIQSTGVAAVFKRVRDDVTSWIALDGGAPVFHRADVRFGSKEAAIETRFGPGPFRIDVSRLNRTPRTYTQALPSDHTAHDAHSLLGTLRAWDVPAGTHAYAYVLSGRRVWHLTTTHSGRETIETALGSFEAVRIDGVAWRLEHDLQVAPDRDPRLFRIWLADDATKAPLLIEAVTEHGTLSVELIEYGRPEMRVTAAPRR